MARNGVAVNALTFFGEPLNKGGGVADFTFGFRQRFPLLEGHQTSEIVLILHHKIEPAAQNVRPLFGGEGTPGGKGAVSGLDRLSGFVGAHFRHAAELLAVGRVGHRNHVAVGRIAPLTINQRLLAKQSHIVELHNRFLSSGG